MKFNSLQKKCKSCTKLFWVQPCKIKMGKGKFCSQVCSNRANARFGKKNHEWKGDKVSYRVLHHWVVRHLGKATVCSFCGNISTYPRSIQWANKSHNYCRELNDWISLCIPCHKKYDLKVKKL